jgi:hypothetical protein
MNQVILDVLWEDPLTGILTPPNRFILDSNLKFPIPKYSLNYSSDKWKFYLPKDVNVKSGSQDTVYVADIK